jgi:glycosyltransferase involved in cell wall biosynthesis
MTDPMTGPMTGPTPTFEASVIVPCYNSARHLTPLLEGLAAQTFAGVWELIVVNRGSTDGTAQIVREHAHHFPHLNLIDEPDNHGVSFSRNDGAARARGENIVFIDSDDIPNPTYLAAMLEALENSAFVCASMDYAALNPDWIVAAFANEIEGGVHNPVAPYANGGNIGIKKSVFDSLGGFDTTLPAFEDLDFSWRVFKLGHRMILVRDAVLAYRVNPDLGALYRKCYRDSLPNARVLKKNFPGYVPAWMCLLGLGARAALIALSTVTLWNRGRVARWVLACAYWRGDLEGCFRTGYLHLLPKGRSPRETRA